jgi:hypothetical protein
VITLKKAAFLSFAVIASTVTILSFLLSSCGGGTTLIDWVDFVRLNDISYESDGTLLSGEQIGEKIGEVSGNVPNEISGKYKGNIEKNGDAAFLPVGTGLYEIKGYSSEKYVAAFVDGKYKLYKARDSEDLSAADDSSATESGGRDETGGSSLTRDPRSDSAKYSGTMGGTDDGTKNSASSSKNGAASFDAEVINYVRTFGEVGSYAPDGSIICSETEAESFYKSKGSASSFDSSGSLRGALGNYDSDFFKSKCLAVIDFEESSGSNSHKVTDVSSKGGTLTITIKRIVPDVGTCDMAHWYILVPVERASYSTLKVIVDGKEYKINLNRKNSSADGEQAPGKGGIEPFIEDINIAAV